MRIQASLVLGAFIVCGGAAAFAQGLRIDPFPLQGGGGAIVSAAPVAPVAPVVSESAMAPMGQKVSERIGDQVRRSDVGGRHVISNASEMSARLSDAQLAPVGAGALPDASLENSSGYGLGVQRQEVALQARQQLAEPRAMGALPEPVTDVVVSSEAVQAFQPVAAVPVSQSAVRAADAPGLVRMAVPDWVQLRSNSAAEDDSLEGVLRKWSSQEGVELDWRSPVDFPVLAAISGGVTYEVSVRALLDQYLDSPKRPVASLHIDTQTGARTLLVKLDDRF